MINCIDSVPVQQKPAHTCIDKLYLLYVKENYHRSNC